MGRDKTKSKVKRVPIKIQVKFLQRFTELVENGIAVFDALEIMETVVDKWIIKMMKVSCEAGLPFSDVLESLGFQAQVVYIVRASEEHNALLTGLVRAREFSNNYLNNREDVIKKMRYPLFLMSAIIFVLATVGVFFLPRLDEFYLAFGIENDNMAIGSIIWVLAMVFVAACFLVLGVIVTLKCHNKNFQRFLRKWGFKIPVVSRVTMKIFTYYFATQLEMFISCGLSFKESLGVIQEFDTMPIMKLIAWEIEYEAAMGASIDDLLLRMDCFTNYFKLIMVHSLRIGKLDIELKRFAKAEMKRLNDIVATGIKLVQGSLMGLVGILIALLYISILQPVFDLISII